MSGPAPVSTDALRAHAREVHLSAVRRWLRIEAAATMLLVVLDDGSPGEVEAARRDLARTLEGSS